MEIFLLTLIFDFSSAAALPLSIFDSANSQIGLTKSVPSCTGDLNWFPYGPFSFDVQQCGDALAEGLEPLKERWKNHELKFGKDASTSEIRTPQKFQRGIFRVISRRSHAGVTLK